MDNPLPIPVVTRGASHPTPVVIKIIQPQKTKKRKQVITIALNNKLFCTQNTLQLTMALQPITQIPRIIVKIKIKRHFCYLLYSPSTNRTYFGYTVDPFRRIRQHNREIVGGAKKTTKGVPWTLICYIAGFPNQRTALQFEWKNNHPTKGKHDHVHEPYRLS